MKNKKLGLVLTWSLFSPLSVRAVVILVHGTFGADSSWCRPGGDFYNNLEAECAVINQHLIPFTWTGALSNRARVQAAEALARVVLSYPDDEEQTLIGHSHGGNVIAIATQLLNSPFNNYLYDKEMPKEQVEKLTEKHFSNLINMPYDELTKSTTPQEKEAYKQDMIKRLAEASRSIAKLRVVRHRSPTGAASNIALIKRAYLIGTPIDVKRYMPDLAIVQEVHSFYSNGDRIQPVLGLYKQVFPKQDRVVNYRITIEGSGGFWNDDPSHTETHLPVVAKWILSIPHAACEQKIGNFENYSPHCNGKIHFSNDKPPVYEKDEEVTDEHEESEEKGVVASK
jgi:hypothetical protein